jgi:hypothetical protein
MRAIERYLVLFARTYLGAFNFAAGLNYFVLVWPQPVVGEPVAAAYVESTMQLGLFQIAKVLETVGGFCLLTNFLAPLGLVLLFPVTATIFVVNTLYSDLAHVQMIGARNMLLHLFLFAAYAQYFYPLLKLRAAVSPVWRDPGRMLQHFQGGRAA